MAKTRVSQCAYTHTSDIGTAPADGNECTGLATICVSRGTALLEKKDPGGYGEVQRHTMSRLLKGMLSTHRNIRKLLEQGSDDPGSVDAMALARLQFETLYVICLMLERTENVDWYLHDGWQKQYIEFLLTREECKGLTRYDEYMNKTPIFLTTLRDFLGITPDQQFTIDHRELGTPLPAGSVKKEIKSFPTPGRTIETIVTPDRRKMLERLYPEYVQLCSFSHALAPANFFKTMFDHRLPDRAIFPLKNLQEMFEKHIVSEAFYVSILSMTQSAVELLTLYPGDVDLTAAGANAWNALTEGSLLAKAVWSIRTRQLLGAVA
jgi:hypothetical protein